MHNQNEIAEQLPIENENLIDQVSENDNLIQELRYRLNDDSIQKKVSE